MNKSIKFIYLCVNSKGMRRDRLKIIKKIEESRKSKVLVYLTGDRPNALANIAEDAVRPMYDHILKFGKVKNIDLFLYSRGGDVSTPWKIISMLREYCDNLTVLIPSKAYSAATLIALGADKIIMGPKAELGPIDPTLEMSSTGQINKPINTEDVIAYVSFMKEKVNLTDQAALCQVTSQLAQDITPLTLGTIYRTYSHIRLVAKKMLDSHKEKIDESKAQTIVESLTEKMFSHSHGINRREAKGIGLNVEFADDELEKQMWDLIVDYEKELKLLEPLQFNELLLEDEEKELTDLKIALIESVDKIHYFEYLLKIRKLRQIPTQPQINVNLNLTLPANIEISKIPEETQKIVNQLLQDAAGLVTEQVRREIIRQSPQVDIQILPIRGGWNEK
ncbi:MAG: hypothetical protein PWQ28_225 [Candidatus Woesearchaeota archaeon]|nr:hypothetical protein [Candidatus Woesearchaeota archaeon]